MYCIAQPGISFVCPVFLVVSGYYFTGCDGASWPNSHLLQSLKLSCASKALDFTFWKHELWHYGARIAHWWCGRLRARGYRVRFPLRPIYFLGSHICSYPNCSHSWHNDNRKVYPIRSVSRKHIKKNRNKKMTNMSKYTCERSIKKN